MAVVRKTKTASKTKTTSRPTTTKRATATRTTSTKATPKRTAAKPATRTRKPVTPTSTRTAKAANARATGKTTATKKTTAATKSRNVKTVEKPKAAPRTGPNRVVDELTGFAVGTDSQVIATELLKGGADRAEIIERCTKKLPAKSNRGTTKPVANMVASVLGKMRDQGYTVESTWVLTPPTRASKAKATRARNARLGK